MCIFLYINYYKPPVDIYQFYANKLKLKSTSRIKKYILILDQYTNKNVDFNNGYPMFNYYRKKGRYTVIL